MKKKKFYLAPETEIIDVELSSAPLCSSYGKNNQPGKGWGTDVDDDEIIDGGTF